MESIKKNNKVEFYFGNIGAVIPFLTMLFSIVLLVITGHRATKYYWSAAVLGVFVGYILIKDKKEFNSIAVRGLGNDMFAVLCLAFIFAGIFGKALSVGGLAQGILWLANKFGISGAFFPAAIFAIAALLSTATGTANGTAATVTPVFMPTAIALGCNPALVMGAIVGGSYFGDNLAPISDTTIVSASTQGTTVGEAVRTRLKYSIAAGTITIIITVILGVLTMGEAQIVDSTTMNTAKNLVLIISPILVIVLVIKGMDLVPALLIGTLSAIIIGLSIGTMKFEDVYTTDGGIIVGGIEGMVGIIIFSALMFCMIQMMKESGVIEVFTSYITSIAKTPRSAELAIILICIITTIMVPSNTVAMVMCGSIVRQIIESQRMEKTRGSNLLDGICVSTVGLLPYGAAMLLTHGLTMEMGLISESITTVDMVPYSIYCYILILVYVFSALTGWGRKFIVEENINE